jgi:microcystin-dependent protein
MKKLIIAIAFAGEVLAGFAAGAAFTYQGAVKNVGGTPLTGNQTVEFRLYTQATGGTPVWARKRNVLLNANGLFNTSISDDGDPITGTPETPLAAVLANNANTTLYIGLTVDETSGEISPRQALLAVPYAMHAADVTAASGDFAVEGLATFRGGMTVTGAVNMPAMTVASASVNGDVSSAGTVRANTFAGYGTVPLGCIVLWSGSASDIPDGWALCDGQTVNGRRTPDLRGRFVVGYDSQDNDYNTVGHTGGAKEVTLTVEQLPAHKHNTSVHTVGYAAAYNGSKEAATYDSNGKNNGNMDISGDNTGGGRAHENRPPYYTICFIMRVK